VEKIVADDAVRPSGWGVDGTTGYDFLGDASALLHDPDGEARLTTLWTTLSHRSGEFELEQRRARSEAAKAFESQISAAALVFAEAANGHAAHHDLSAPVFRRTLIRLIECLHVYRCYLTGVGRAPVPPHIARALAESARDTSPVERQALDFIVSLLAGDTAAERALAADAARRFNQLSSSIAAKGVEDTAFYRHAVLLSRNDVGCDPEVFSITPAAFHASCARRAELFPSAMLATATHDHKRGEDSRARLAVLSEIAGRWEAAVREWLSLTERCRPPRVELGEVYHLFQTLVGAWPYGLPPGNTKGLEDFRERILGWRTKSLREAKLRTSWMEIDEAYESAHRDFVTTLLDPAQSPQFLQSLIEFVAAIPPAGAANALAQTVLRLMAPGVPDTYQGTEFWDFSLVDPDNRRDVDFAARRSAIEEAPHPALVESWQDGHIKQAVIARLLHHRASDPELFATGTYIPLATEGLRRDSVVAFARRHESRFVLVTVARCCAGALVGSERLAPDNAWWADTSIAWDIAATDARDLLKPKRRIKLTPAVRISALLSELPVCVLAGSV
jgi:(1->4)-alpha-D-glucan 1-alpha-D-glucosylmutase